MNKYESMKKLSSLLVNFVDLLYPRTCVVCGNMLYRNENCMCIKCIYKLPVTNYHKEIDNPVSRLFWGRANIVAATAFFHFNKGSMYQPLLHKLKYKGEQEIGIELGKYIGHGLLASELYKNIDLILPVPLHPKKQKTRGYNQSECIARGISQAMDIPVDTKSLKRVKHSSTQTRKNRFERWQNVETIFKLTSVDDIQNKFVLLVDDVVTTGSTLEACANELHKVPGVKICVATLAVA